jgi:predicted MPP superfamily phosphohydrolase
MSRFLRILVAVTALVHVPVALGVAELARELHWARPALVGTIWAALGVVLFVGRARAGMADRKRHATIVRFVDVPYFIHWCAALFAIVPSVLATVVGPLMNLARGVPAGLPMRAYMALYLAGLVVCGYGVLVRRRWYHVVEREVRVRGLDPAFDGFRVAHLSDLHIGTLTPRSWGLAWARASNLREPDLAVVTGDMVTSGTAYHDDIAEVVGALRAKHGAVVSMGNHDYFGDAEPLVTRLRARGVKVLRNEGIAITPGTGELAASPKGSGTTGTIWLAAIDDTWTRRDDLAAALRHRPEDASVVLLAHDPERFAQAADAGADLVLSGHTHGGQIAMPFLYRRVSLATLAHTYNVGFYERDGATLYVHPGLGTTGPPIRLGIAPEVTILVLRPG